MHVIICVLAIVQFNIPIPHLTTYFAYTYADLLMEKGKKTVIGIEGFKQHSCDEVIYHIYDSQHVFYYSNPRNTGTKNRSRNWLCRQDN